jgi:hypothetical protein
VIPMEDDDYRALIDELVRQLVAVGARDLAEDGNYIIANPETGEGELLGPRERLIEMLQAFERFLAVRDGGAANIAFGSILATLRRSAETPADPPLPNGVVVELAAERDVARVEISLLDAPNLGPIRNDLDVLIRQLKSLDGDAPPPSRAAP